MIANDAISILNHWNFESGHRLGDGADTISSTFTYTLTMTLAAVMALKTYVLSPIECHIPITLGGSNFGSYVNNYCFVEGSIAIPKKNMKSVFPQSEEQWEEAKKAGNVGYYPWIPLYLSVMAMIPFLISLMWKILYSRRIGTDLQGILEMAHKAQLLDGEERRKCIERISTLIAETLWKNREYRTGRYSRMKNRVFDVFGFGFFSKRYGSWLNFWYFLVKLAYLGSHILAIYAMHRFLNIGNSHQFFGFQVFRNIINGNFWEDTLLFPRVTWCNVPIKHNRVVMSLAQCVLPGNLFSEIIFALLWIWHVIVMIPMILSLIKYTSRSLSRTNRRHFIRKCLILSGEMDDVNPMLGEKIKSFGQTFLRQDGFFMLTMFESAVGTAVTCDLLASLWRNFNRRNVPPIYERVNTVLDMDESNNGEKVPFANNGNGTMPLRTMSDQ